MLSSIIFFCIIFFHIKSWIALLIRCSAQAVDSIWRRFLKLEHRNLNAMSTKYMLVITEKSISIICAGVMNTYVLSGGGGSV